MPVHDDTHPRSGDTVWLSPVPEHRIRTIPIADIRPDRRKPKPVRRRRGRHADPVSRLARWGWAFVSFAVAGGIGLFIVAVIGS